MEPRPNIPRRISRTTQLAFIVLGLCLLAATACLYDPDARCRSGRVLQGNLCYCPEGTVEMAGNCVVMTEAPAELGQACDADASCKSEEFSFCQMRSVDDGYCTSHGCTVDQDCGGDYYCAKNAEPTFCKRFPTGTREACASQSDCADFDANYCLQSSMGSVCLVPNCADNADCPPGYSCMDISAFIPGTPMLCIMNR